MQINIGTIYYIEHILNYNGKHKSHDKNIYKRIKNSRHFNKFIVVGSHSKSSFNSI